MLKLIKYELRKNRPMLLGMLGAIAAAEIYFLLSLAFEWETHLVLSTAIMPNAKLTDRYPSAIGIPSFRPF